MIATLDFLQRSIVLQDWPTVQVIMATHSFPYSDELVDMLETLLFSIDETNTDLTEIVDSIIQPFLDSIFDRHFHHCGSSCPTLVHHLCMENKHYALAILLRNLDPQTASREVQKTGYISVNYTENIGGQAIYHDLNFYHSPMQAAWEGMLFDKEMNLAELDENVLHRADDLPDDWKALWKTTVYLLLAFDGKPIDMDFATFSDWNILHAIARYSCKAHSAVTWLAVKLYPHLAEQVSHHGDLPIHEAAKNEKYYSSFRSALDEKRREEGLCFFDSSPHSDDDDYFLFSSDRHKTGRLKASFRINRYFRVCSEINSSPMILLLKAKQESASIADKKGRLPLHLVFTHHIVTEQHKLLGGRDGDTLPDDSEQCYKMDSLDVVNSLVAANPDALDCAEPLTGLHPFMLAANTYRTLSSGLDITFTLLKQNPKIIENIAESSQIDSQADKFNSEKNICQL